MECSDYHILVVDDEEDIAEICAETFEIEDFKTTLTLNATAGLEVFNSENIDVVISDHLMPGMTGLELLEEIKKTGKKMPLFYLSTGDDETSEADLIEKGAKGLILKPYALDQVVERIKKDLGIE